jgi:hypothetical protein
MMAVSIIIRFSNLPVLDLNIDANSVTKPFQAGRMKI